MKIIHFILVFIGLSLCYCDPVQCLQLKGSEIGYVASCNSMHPFPLKITYTVTLNMSQYFRDTSWNFYLRNYKGQLTVVSGCILTNPTYDVYNKGKNLTIGITCFELPRQLTEGDYIHVNFFDNEGDSFRLTFLIPILGYSSGEGIQKASQINKIQHNQIQNNNQLGQTVQCQGVQGSIKAAYVNCTSTRPFPLKVTTTIMLLSQQYVVFGTDFRFWLRQAKGQIMKVENCTLNLPPNKPYYKGDNITVGITCYQLPRQVKMYDSIMITLFQVDNLTYLIPIYGYNSQRVSLQLQLQNQNQNQFQTTNNLLFEPQQSFFIDSPSAQVQE